MIQVSTVAQIDVLRFLHGAITGNPGLNSKPTVSRQHLLLQKEATAAAAAAARANEGMDIMKPTSIYNEKDKLQQQLDEGGGKKLKEEELKSYDLKRDTSQLKELLKRAQVAAAGMHSGSLSNKSQTCELSETKEPPPPPPAAAILGPPGTPLNVYLQT